MKCLTEIEILSCLDGQVEEQAALAFRRHIDNCEKCRAASADLRTIAEGLATQQKEFDDPALRKEIMTLIEMGRGQSTHLPKMKEDRFRLRRFIVPVSAVAAIIPLLFIFGVPKSQSVTNDTPEGFNARGAAASFDNWVSLELFYRDTGGESPRYLPVKDTLSPSSAVAVAYEDHSSDPYPYLMVFDVDPRGEVHWYYPAHTDPAEDQVSIFIGEKGGRMTLPDEITHTLPPGRHRFFGLFSKSPLRIMAVEEAISKLTNAGRLPLSVDRLPFEETGQWSKEVNVMRESEQ
jgi:hypothetical protein